MNNNANHTRKITIEKIKELIYAESGMIFESFREEILLKRLYNRQKVLGLKSPEEYLNFFGKKSLVEKKTEMDFLITQLTVNETFFFRDFDQFKFLKENILPEIKNFPVSILHLGCSSGEEPYSTAIILSEFFKGQTDDFNITACDIDKDILQIAKSGKYSIHGKNFANISPDYLRKYFSREDEFYHISDFIKKKINFLHINIANYSFADKFDVIFCKNVMIYLCEKIKLQIIDKISNSLKTNGYFFLGNTEILDNNAKSAFHKISKKTNVFQKKIYDTKIQSDELKYSKKIHLKEDFQEIPSKNIHLRHFEKNKAKVESPHNIEIFEIKLNGVIDSRAADSYYTTFLEQMNKIFETSNKKIMIDLTDVFFIERQALEKIIKAAGILKKAEKKLIIINPHNNIGAMISRMEMDDILNIFNNKKDGINFFARS